MDFAQDVFDYISKQNDCVVITLDITKFFDNLNHSLLYKAWTSLLQEERLPSADWNIYKAITNFSFVDETDLLKEFNIKNKRELRQKNIHCYCKTPKEFRERVVKKGLIKKCVHVDQKNRFKGIPQGTAISAFLSNLYLLKFDENFFNNYAKEQDMFLYRRYSDDILIVCSKEKYKNILEYVNEKLNKEFYLKINPQKTQIRFFKKNESVDRYGFVNDELGNPAEIQYLGFDFNGKFVSLKKQGLAKFYRKMKKNVRVKAHRAGMLSEKEFKKGYRSKFIARKFKFKKKGIFKKKIYRKYSLMSKANFLGYARRSSQEIRMDNNINKQISKSWQNLQKEIFKYKYYEDNSDSNTVDFDFF